MEREAIVGSKRYLRELGSLQSWGQARWLSWGHDLALLPSAVWLSERVPDSALVLRSSSINVLLSGAESGLGLLLISKAFTSARGLVLAELSRAMAKEVASVPAIELWLVGHRSLRDVPRIAAVWQFIIDGFAESEAGQARSRKRAKP